MSKDNIFMKIKENIKNLSQSERKVANFITKAPTDIMFDTINELSEKVGTSTTTIMRLASKLGYSGYTELQRDIQKFLKDGKAPQSRLASNLQNIEKDNLWTETVDFHTTQLQQFSNQVDEQTLDKAINLIENANNI